MKNFYYASLEGLSKKNGTSYQQHLSLQLPGDPNNPQDWIIYASASCAAYETADTAADSLGSVFRVDIWDPSTGDVSGGDNINIATVSDVFQNSSSALPQTHLAGVYMLKDHVGAGSNGTFLEIGFSTKIGATDAAGLEARLYFQRILCIRVPKERLNGEVLFHNDESTTTIGTSLLPVGTKNFTPVKGRYLILSTLQQTFANSASGRVSGLNFSVIQSTNATTESGATNRLIESVPNDAYASGTLATSKSYRKSNYTTGSFAISRSICHTFMEVVDLESEPTCATWEAEASAASAFTIDSIRTLVIPLDGNFTYSYDRHSGWEETDGGGSDQYFMGGSSAGDGVPCGVAGKDSFVLLEGTSYIDALTLPHIGFEAETAGELMHYNTLMLYAALEDSIQAVGCGRLTGKDFIDMKYNCSLPGAEQIMKHAIVVCFTDMQSKQGTSVATQFDFEISQDSSIAEVKNPISHAVAEALSDVAIDGKPVYTNTVPVIKDQLPNNISIAASDTELTRQDVAGLG